MLWAWQYGPLATFRFAEDVRDDLAVAPDPGGNNEDVARGDDATLSQRCQERVVATCRSARSTCSSGSLASCFTITITTLRSDAFGPGKLRPAAAARRMTRNSAGPRGLGTPGGLGGFTGHLPRQARWHRTGRASA